MVGVIRRLQELTRYALFAGTLLIICGVGLALGSPRHANLQVTAVHGSTTVTVQPQSSDGHSLASQNSDASGKAPASIVADGPETSAPSGNEPETASVQPKPCLETSDTTTTCKPVCSPCYRYAQATVMCPLSASDTAQIACRAPCEPLTSGEIATIYCE